MSFKSLHYNIKINSCETGILFFGKIMFCPPEDQTQRDICAFKLYASMLIKLYDLVKINGQFEEHTMLIHIQESPKDTNH